MIDLPVCGSNDLRLKLPSPTCRRWRHKPYRVRRHHGAALTNIKPGPTATLRLRNATVIAQKPMKIRPRILSGALTLRSGQLFTVDAQNRTQTDLNKLGIFRSVNLGVTPLDSLRAPTRWTSPSTRSSTIRWKPPWKRT